MMSNKILFFGNERLATGVETNTPLLKALIAAGYDVQAVVTQHEIGKSRKPRQLEIAAVAEAHNIPVLLPNKMSEVIDDLAAYNAEIGVLVAFGKIVPQALIDIFPKGIVNIHPSALPKHRGPTPLESVLLAGETKTAVSLMSLGAKMDAGPIYAQQFVTLTGTETKQALADNLLEVGTKMIIEHLPAILNGTLTATPQNDAEATYDSLITRDAGIIDWQLPAAQIERQVRAYALWPKSRTLISGRDVVITKAHCQAGVGEIGTVVPGVTTLGIYTSDGVLVIDELVPAGKNPMSGSDFLRGYRP